MGGRNSRSKEHSSNVQYGTNVWGPQQGYLQDVYSRAQGAANAYDPSQGYAGADRWQGAVDQGMGQLGQAAQGYAGGYGQLGQAAQGFAGGYGQLGQAAQGFAGGYGALGNAQGTYNETLQNLRRFQNFGTDPMMDVYARQTGQMFNEQIMPGLKGDAMVGGGLGGSRAGIAQGLAGARMGQQLQDFSAQLYGQNMDRALQATQGMGQVGQAMSGLADQYGNLAQGQTALGGMYGNLAQGQTALGGMYGNLAQGQGQLGGMMADMGSMYGQIGDYRNQLPFQGINQYAALIGSPTMQDMGGGGASNSRSFNRGFGLNSG
jgi:hypothetical protein